MKCQCSSEMVLVKKKKSNGSFMYVFQCPDCGDFIRGQEKKPPFEVPMFNEDLFERLKKIRLEKYRSEQEKKNDEWRKEQEKKNEAWWGEYSQYLNSDAWITRRGKVLHRDRWVCQSCLEATATEVHHLTYKHVGNEPLFDLVSVCHECHEKITGMDRKTREVKS